MSSPDNLQAPEEHVARARIDARTGREVLVCGDEGEREPRATEKCRAGGIRREQKRGGDERVARSSAQMRARLCDAVERGHRLVVQPRTGSAGILPRAD